MSDTETCNTPGCYNLATRITATEARYIVVCEECFHEKYRV